MIASIEKVAVVGGTTPEILFYSSSSQQFIEAICVNDWAAVSAYVYIGLYSKGAAKGVVLKEGPIANGGQLIWTGALTLNPDDEIRTDIYGHNIGDSLSLRIKIR